MLPKQIINVMGINETAVLVTAGDYGKSLARSVVKLGIYMPSPLTKNKGGWRQLNVERR